MGRIKKDEEETDQNSMERLNVKKSLRDQVYSKRHSLVLEEDTKKNKKNKRLKQEAEDFKNAKYVEEEEVEDIKDGEEEFTSSRNFVERREQVIVSNGKLIGDKIMIGGDFFIQTESECKGGKKTKRWIRWSQEEQDHLEKKMEVERLISENNLKVEIVNEKMFVYKKMENGDVRRLGCAELYPKEEENSSFIQETK